MHKLTETQQLIRAVSEAQRELGKLWRRNASDFHVKAAAAQLRMLESLTPAQYQDYLRQFDDA